MDKPKVVLGVSGGIAAYKACELLRRLTESGHDVRVVPTAASLNFVGEATWAALSGNPAGTEVWETVHEVPHVRIGQGADLVVVAPATADMLAKAAHGLADDLLTNTLLTARCPVVFAPAMHTEMWEHPATQENVATLRRRGALVIEPAVGRLTGKDTGKGRLPDPEEIYEVCRSVLRRHSLARGVAEPDLVGRHVVISAGGTREPLDPVRFLGNRSSGKQGYALARTAVARGARVTLVAANTALADPAGVDVVRVGTAVQLREAVLKAAADADAVVMAAAVADFRPAEYADGKIKKKDGQDPAPVALVRNPDVLAEISADRAREGQVVVGFAAETDNVLANGRAKLLRKGCDLLVVNEVGASKTFGSEENEAVILASSGAETPVPYGPKEALAEVIWDQVAPRLAPRRA
ncbi:MULTISPECIES: bifunctional phosphopantothenoylcysteine decarboxylase/phosphopantothenate--cysteine ligase CoaBC [unclassified Streptomyces]|uniref:bifunctional phosphopantothenoylcysteine decarboxylase/phosphopantothenate--cysteine ligase CoaBC n=1 Tax=unclassified Streptomyces TaxID=2593676 RepID=UPI0022539BD4|nr:MULTISPECIES: bifunctional phosphopantothenoylcysteine decarboxylase/phosphopantothenate--cysteine ligase CoaBC [unclassified Streptomyces]MCX5148814.1 bifunctional phosphopantothenoylcysteine decarboxylase/phosphopantothenate--cysteine ligase CoaBC [Streptomyces sp. NBC_00320]WSN51871.1 bifunctional phosphopantothenoylcysteine decarboxylase/phosphopantothenate--cysteine ligase CoaBC [Streptomyces sp. NBC_01296]WSW58707.1 bifunctional phosphopantothenoylcysteine decarboxylase/phosphopantothen